MLAEVYGLVLGDHVVQGGSEEGKESIVLAHNTIGQGTILPSSEVLIVDIESG